MKKTLFILLSMAIGTAMSHAQKISGITFDNGRLTLTDDICCGFSLSPDKTPKAPKTRQG